MTRFTRLLDIFDDMYDVPTKEEYEELKQSISERFERLESRIAAIEKPLEKNTVTFKRDGEKTMNDVELYTNNLTIMVRLDGYDDKDFDVAIEAGDNRKVITVTAHDVKRLSIDKNLCKIEHILLTYFLLDDIKVTCKYFLLDDIKVTCKYPVVVRYNDVIFCKTIEPTKESPDNEKTQITLMNGAGDTLELEGTEKQIEAFEAERKERNDRLFPSCMSFMQNVRLALEHGLTVKKITTQENKEK